MLILAIDTALDACAAAVLDTDANKLLAHESLPMKRGHAEALMPLIARVMKASGIAFDALDRIAATTGPGSFTGLRVGLSAARGIALAANKPVVGLTTLTAYAAPVVSENGEHPIISAIDARHDHVYFQVVSGDGGSLVKPKVAPISPRRSRRRASARRIWSAMPPGFSPTAGRRTRRRRSRSIRCRRPTSAGWRGSAPPSVRKPRRPVPIICARPTPSRQRIRCSGRRRRHHDGRPAAILVFQMAEAAVLPLWSNRSHCVTPQGWRNCMAPRFIAAGAKANSRPC